MSPLSAVTLYTWVFAVCVAGSSLQSLLHGGHGPWINVLAGVEVGAAALFLFDRTRHVGLAALLVIFVIAAGHHPGDGVIPFRFVIYAASALLVTHLHKRLKAGA